MQQNVPVFVGRPPLPHASRGAEAAEILAAHYQREGKALAVIKLCGNQDGIRISTGKLAAVLDCSRPWAYECMGRLRGKAAGFITATPGDSPGTPTLYRLTAGGNRAAEALLEAGILDAAALGTLRELGALPTEVAP